MECAKQNDIVLEDFLINLVKDVKLASLITRTPMIVVYKNTVDYGDKYIARLWKYKKLDKRRFNSFLPQQSHIATEYIISGNSMNEIRNKIPWFLNFIPRYQNDDPCIVGSVYLGMGLRIMSLQKLYFKHNIATEWLIEIY